MSKYWINNYNINWSNNCYLLFRNFNWLSKFFLRFLRFLRSSVGRVVLHFFKNNWLINFFLLIQTSQSYQQAANALLFLCATLFSQPLVLLNIVSTKIKCTQFFIQVSKLRKQMNALIGKNRKETWNFACEAKIVWRYRFPSLPAIHLMSKNHHK